jgi:hypothetical protein
LDGTLQRPFVTGRHANTSSYRPSVIDVRQAKSQMSRRRLLGGRPAVRDDRSLRGILHLDPIFLSEMLLDSFASQ